MNRNWLLGVTFLGLLGAFGVGAVLYRGREVPPPPVAAAAPVDLERYQPARAVHLGDPAARVVLVEFFDPACGTCAQFAPILKDMAESSGGRIQLVERYAPLHPGSTSVVAVLEASRRQDKYWETLDRLFATQASWADHSGARMDQVWSVLEGSGLDLDRLRTDAEDPAIAAIIQQDLADAAALGVKQTPEFFVNGKPLPTWGLKQLQALVSSELAAAYGSGS